MSQTPEASMNQTAFDSEPKVGYTIGKCNARVTGSGFTGNKNEVRYPISAKPGKGKCEHCDVSIFCSASLDKGTVE